MIAAMIFWPVQKLLHKTTREWKVNKFSNIRTERNHTGIFNIAILGKQEADSGDGIYKYSQNPYL